MTRICVVGGGANGEHDVSLGSAAAVAQALEGRHDVVRLTIDRTGFWRDGERRPLGLAGAVQVITSCDVVVPMLHGAHGEDGTLAALCDLAGVRCVGSPVGAAAIAMDKWATKLVADAVGVRTAAGTLLHHGTTVSFAGPCVVKPVTAGSSLGVTLVTGPEQLPGALAEAFAYDDRVLVEERVIGREIDIAILRRPDGCRMVAAPLEICGDGIFDYATKYGGSAQFAVPADVTPAERLALEDAAVRVYDALGCDGVVRVDFFLTPSGPVLNEVNTTPGFTEHSQVPRMFAATGVSYAELLELLVGDALAAA